MYNNNTTQIVNKLFTRIFGTALYLGWAILSVTLFFVGLALCLSLIGAIIGIPLMVINAVTFVGCLLCALQALVKGDLTNNFFDQMIIQYHVIEQQQKQQTQLKVNEELLKSNYGPFTTFTVENKNINN
jgi:ABC-type antimicrobial peptide transport system permease subunit